MDETKARMNARIHEVAANIRQHAWKEDPVPRLDLRVVEELLLAFAAEVRRETLRDAMNAVKHIPPCPFDRKNHGLTPEQPCPICGDLGTFSATDSPSRCETPWAAIRALSPQAGPDPNGRTRSETMADDPRVEAATRFFDKFIPEPNSGCWLWLDAPHGRGYGRLFVGGKPVKAHRFSWEFHNGPIPDGLVIDHRVCRNKLCVNPDHMVICTNAENLAQIDGSRSGNGDKTHCSRGHRFSAENTLNTVTGWRDCRACRTLRNREHKARKKARRNG